MTVDIRRGGHRQHHGLAVRRGGPDYGRSRFGPARDARAPGSRGRAVGRPGRRPDLRRRRCCWGHQVAARWGAVVARPPTPRHGTAAGSLRLRPLPVTPLLLPLADDRLLVVIVGLVGPRLRVEAMARHPRPLSRFARPRPTAQTHRVEPISVRTYTQWREGCRRARVRAVDAGVGSAAPGTGDATSRCTRVTGHSDRRAVGEADPVEPSCTGDVGAALV